MTDGDENMTLMSAGAGAGQSSAAGLGAESGKRDLGLALGLGLGIPLGLISLLFLLWCFGCLPAWCCGPAPYPCCGAGGGGGGVTGDKMVVRSNTWGDPSAMNGNGAAANGGPIKYHVT